MIEASPHTNGTAYVADLTLTISRATSGATALTPFVGTRNQAAQPFLRPAIDENEDVVVEGLKTALDKKIAKALKAGK